MLTVSASALTGKNWLWNCCLKLAQDWIGKTPVSASWWKRFSDHLAARPSLKKTRVQKIFSSLQLNCSGARHRYNVQELKKAQLEVCSPEKSGREGSFGLVRYLVRTDGVTPQANFPRKITFDTLYTNEFVIRVRSRAFAIPPERTTI